MGTDTSLQIITHIKNQTQRDDYEAWKMIRRHYLNKLKGTLYKKGVKDEETMSDIVNTSLAVLFHNVIVGKFKGNADLGTYLTSIAIYKWYNHIRAKNKTLNHKSTQETTEIELYLHDKLKGEALQTFKKKLETDSDFQEVVESYRNAQNNQLFLQYSDEMDRMAEKQVVSKSQEVKNLILKVFPDGNCQKVLLDYYFKHGGKYGSMVAEVRRKKETFEEVYGRLRQQVHRCISKIRKALNS